MRKIRANYSQPPGRAIGGKLAFHEDSLVFSPNSVEKLTGCEQIEIPHTDIISVGKEDRFSRGIQDTLFGGGLRKRLKIETDGGEFLFVVSNVDKIVEDIEALSKTCQTPPQVTGDTDAPSSTTAVGEDSASIDASTAVQYCPQCSSGLDNRPNFCPECGCDVRSDSNASVEGQTPDEPPNHKHDKKPNETRDRQWDPRSPVLSVFASIMLMWGGFYSLGQSGGLGSDFILFTILGVVIVPRVRREISEIIQAKTHRDPTGMLPMLVVGSIYTLLVAAVALLMIGEAVNDPTMSAGAGFLSIVIALIIAFVIVGSLRVYRRFSGS